MFKALLAENCTATFIFAISVWYIVMPLAAYFLIFPYEYFIILAEYATIAVISIYIGSKIPVFTYWRKSDVVLKVTNEDNLHIAIWGFFLTFFLTALISADAIPLLSAVSGADPAQLDRERGEFLKGRTGIFASLAYLNTLVVTAFIPYSLSSLFGTNNRYRMIVLLIFLFYCVSYLVKTLFFTAIVPVFYIYAVRNKVNLRTALGFLLAFIILLTAMTWLTTDSGTSDDSTDPTGNDISLFFESSYRPAGGLNHVLWRSIAVPVFTAADTLRVHQDIFGGEPLMGRTSGLLSILTSSERIPFEKHVFAEQWGWNDSSNANAVFFTEGYINFGLTGIVMFGLIVGLTFRQFARSKNSAFQSVWPLYAYGLFNASLIAMLLSNAFLLFFIYFYFQEHKFRRSISKPKIKLTRFSG